MDKKNPPFNNENYIKIYIYIYIYKERERERGFIQIFEIN